MMAGFIAMHISANQAFFRYIRSLNYNGKNYTKNYLNHFDLLKGGRLLFNMDNKPNMGRGVNESDYPYSFSRD